MNGTCNFMIRLCFLNFFIMNRNFCSLKDRKQKTSLICHNLKESSTRTPDRGHSHTNWGNKAGRRVGVDSVAQWQLPDCLLFKISTITKAAINCVVWRHFLSLTLCLDPNVYDMKSLQSQNADDVKIYNDTRWSGFSEVHFMLSVFPGCRHYV